MRMMLKIRNRKQGQNTKSNLEKKNKVGGFTLFQDYKAIVIKMSGTDRVVDKFIKQHTR